MADQGLLTHCGSSGPACLSCGIAGHSHWAAIALMVFFSIFTIPAALGDQKNPSATKLFLLFIKFFAKYNILLI